MTLRLLLLLLWLSGAFESFRSSAFRCNAPLWLVLVSRISNGEFEFAYVEAIPGVVVTATAVLVATTTSRKPSEPRLAACGTGVASSP